jgi:hypothetical protein
MRKVILFASNFICLAEHSLSGLKAWARRVMAEWLKTPCLVSSKDLSLIRLDTSWKIVGNPTIPRQTHIFLTNRGLYEATYI